MREYVLVFLVAATVTYLLTVIAREIAVRTGACDATVHDSAMLEELIKLPEWKKFSARLPAGPRSTLAFVVPAGDKKSIAALRKVADEWAASGYPDALMKKAVQNIAFEVYLDQDVSDCH